MLVLTLIDTFDPIRYQPKRVRHRIKKIKPLKSNNVEVQLKRTRPVVRTPNDNNRLRTIKLVSDRIAARRAKAKPKIVLDDNQIFNVVVNDIERIINREVDIKDLRGSIEYWIMLNTLLKRRTNYHHAKKKEKAEYIGGPINETRDILISFIREILPRNAYYEKKGYLSDNKGSKPDLHLPSVQELNPSNNSTISKIIMPYRALHLIDRDSKTGWVTSENLFRHYGEVE